MNNNISKEQFIAIFAENDSKFDLPKLWDGRDYYVSLFRLFQDYLSCLPRSNSWEMLIYKKAEKVCDSLLDIVSSYLQGFPAKAFSLLEKLMNEEFEKNPLYFNSDAILDLYRMVKVEETVIYGRERVYHVPYHLRAKIATCRYSIAGYPSLYLSSSLELCDEETKLFSSREMAIASKFWIRRISRPDMHIVDFGYRPQDIIVNESSIETFLSYPEINIYDDPDVNWDKLIPKFDTTRLERYLIWYPLIASCSFIRSNRSNPFAPEYVVPQLVTQWIRTKTKRSLTGIRYFSCASMRASSLGHNYVFPTSGNQIIENGMALDYCPKINEAFVLSKPIFLGEYANLADCDKAMDDSEFGRLAPISEEALSESPALVVPFGVSRICARQFLCCSNIKNIELPETLVSIEEEAFSGCSSITELKLPSNLQEIEEYAFSDCNSLKSLAIPAKVTRIGEGAFSGCISLIEIESDARNPRFVVVEGNLIDKETHTILFGTKPLVNMEDYDIKKIGEAAYKYSKCSISVRIPPSIEQIGADAFSSCIGLREVSFNNGIKSIGAHAFSECKNLREINLPKTVENIGDNAFNNCDRLARLTVDKENKVYCSIGNCIIDMRTSELIAGCKNSIIPERAGVKHIADDAFSNCVGLKCICIPSTVKVIGDRAFWDCSTLSLVTIKNGVEEIGEDAFWRCENLEMVVLPKSIRRIGTRAFLGCNKLRRIQFIGTETDWQNVTKESGWDWDTGNIDICFNC